MKRGEVWRVTTLGRERTVVVVQADSVTAISPSVQTVPLHPSGNVRETLVTVKVCAEFGEIRAGVHSVANVVDAGPFRKERFIELLGAVDAATMDQIDVALRAVFEQ